MKFSPGQRGVALNLAADNALVVGTGVQIRSGGGPGGMAKGGGDFGERCEDELALEHAGMRNLQVRGVDGVIAIEEDVEIDKAWAFGERLLASHLRFDVAEGGEELRGGEVGLGFEDGVEEPGLVEIIDGLGFVDGRELYDVDAGLGKKANGFAKIGFAVADVSAESEIGRGHGRD